jgi:hypothetical protein
MTLPGKQMEKAAVSPTLDTSSLAFCRGRVKAALPTGASMKIARKLGAHLG